MKTDTAAAISRLTERANAPTVCRRLIAPRQLARRPSASPARGYCMFHYIKRSNWCPIHVSAVLSSYCTPAIACTCSNRISWATFDATRATPALFALGPALHPIRESRIAVVLCSRNFRILPTTLAMVLTAPSLLRGRPLSLPITKPISAVERIYHASR